MMPSFEVIGVSRSSWTKDIELSQSALFAPYEILTTNSVIFVESQDRLSGWFCSMFSSGQALPH